MRFWRATLSLSLLLPLTLLVSGDLYAANDCEKLEKSMKREQFVILEREKELSRKVENEKESFSEEEMDRLIQRHHASIARFNLKLESFQDACRQYLASKSKSADGTNDKPVTRVEISSQTVEVKKPDPAVKATPLNKEPATQPSSIAENIKQGRAEPETVAVQKTKAEVTVDQAKSENAPIAEPRRKIRVRKQGGTMPAEEVAASDRLIATLKGRYIQVGAFKEARMATRMMHLLERNGYQYIKITRPYVYAIWVGPYGTYKEAKAAKEKLLNVNKIDGYIIRFK